MRASNADTTKTVTVKIPEDVWVKLKHKTFDKKVTINNHVKGLIIKDLDRS